MDRLFLNPKELLVDAVADWLKARLRTTPGGVPSLTHLLVVVPTRQAGRQCDIPKMPPHHFNDNSTFM